LAKEESRGLGMAQRKYRPEDLQHVQDYEDRTNEAIMILEANAEVVTSLRKFYERLVTREPFSLTNTYVDDVDAFAVQLDNMIYDLKMQISRAKLLVRITADRKKLVSGGSFH
jgi:hypothetical protein